MRIAVVASLAVHAGLIAWIARSVGGPARRPSTPVPRLVMPARPTSSPSEPLVEIVLLDAPPPEPATANAAVLQAKTVSAAHDPLDLAAHPVRNLARLAPAVASAPRDPARNTASDVAPPRRDLLAMRHVDLLSPAQIVDRAPPQIVDRATRTDELRPSGRGTYSTDLGGSHWLFRTATAHVARDGTVQFDNAADFEIHWAELGLAGKFNADDWLARKAGIDPYASAKLAYLDRTRDQRAGIAEANRTADLAHAAIAMRRNLDAVRAIPDPAARRQALFELWDDVSEDGDAALIRAGADARNYLVGVIRSLRPSLEFTPDELAQLNARRRSRAVFAPYE